MNPVEQQERRTAIQHLRADLDKVIADLEARVTNELTGEAALRKRQLALLEARVNRDAVTLLAKVARWTAVETEPLRRPFLGRLRWLCFGTESQP